MKAFLEPLRGLGSFAELEDAMERRPGVYAAAGLTDAGKPHFVYGLDRRREAPGFLSRSVNRKQESCWSRILFLILMRCISRRRIFCFISLIFEEQR